MKGANEARRKAEMHVRLAKLQEHRARLLATFALQGQGAYSVKGSLPRRLLAHASIRIQRIERALRAPPS
jgi:hypothetical protein